MSVSAISDIEAGRRGGGDQKSYKKAFYWSLIFLILFLAGWVICMVILLYRDSNGYKCAVSNAGPSEVAMQSVNGINNISGTARIRGNMMPYPNAVSQGTTDVFMRIPMLNVKDNTWIVYASEIDPTLDNPLSDFNAYITSLQCSKGPKTSLHFSSPTISVLPYYLSENTHANFVNKGGPEQYSLTVSVNGSVAISAGTYIGVGYALSTLKQYIEPSENGCLFRQLPLTIDDKANTYHRDVMLDTGRNYYTVDSILRLLKQMGFHKLNFLSWHITDSQSFALSVGPVTTLFSETPSTDLDFLDMTGAFTPQSVYRTSDLRRIVHTARNYGIVVEAGIDSPGHASSLMYGSKAVTKMLTGSELQIIKYWQLNFQADSNAPEPILGYLDISNKTAVGPIVSVMQAIFEEVYDAFEMRSGYFGSRINLNADEVSTAIIPLADTCSYLNKLMDVFDSNVSTSTRDWSQVNIALWIDVVAEPAVSLTNSTDPNYLNLKRFDGRLTLQLWNMWPSASINQLPAIFKILPNSEAVNFNSNYFYMDAGYAGQMWGGHSFDIAADSSISQVIQVYWVSANPTMAAQYMPPNTGRGLEVSPKKIYTYNFLWDWTGPAPTGTTPTLSQGAVKLVNVVGAGIAVWSETISSGNLDGKIVSNMAALSEVTWKYNEEYAPDNLAHFDYRLHYHLKQLQQAPYLVSSAVQSYSGANFERQFPQGNVMNENFVLGANGDIDQAYLDKHYPTWGIKIRNDHVGCVNNNLLVNLNPEGPLGAKAISQYPVSSRFVYSDQDTTLTSIRVNPWLMSDIAALVAKPTTAKIARSNFASTSPYFADSPFFMDQRDSPIKMSTITI